MYKKNTFAKFEDNKVIDKKKLFGKINNYKNNFDSLYCKNGIVNYSTNFFKENYYLEQLLIVSRHPVQFYNQKRTTFFVATVNK